MEWRNLENNPKTRQNFNVLNWEEFEEFAWVNEAELKQTIKLYSTPQAIIYVSIHQNLGIF